MQLTESPDNEAAILSRLIGPDKPTLSAEAASSLLALEFSPEDKERMHQLAVKNQEGTLTKQEQQALDSYRRVGRLVDLLSAKARLSLQKSGRVH